MTGSKNSSSRDESKAFHWINHDATSMGSLPHRHAIYSHVQKVRQQKAKIHRTKATIPTKRRKRKTETFGAAAPEEPKHTARESLRKDDSSALTVHQHDRNHQESPLSVIGKGNSDPFNSYAISINPHAAQLLKFYRDEIVPSLFPGANTATARRDHWKDCVNGLATKSSALALVAHSSAAAYLVAPESKIAARLLQYQARCVEALRAELDAGNVVRPWTFYNSVNTLLASELISLNVSAARVHGNFLRQSLEEQSKRAPINPKLLMNFLWNNVNLSAMFLVRPILEYENWLPKLFRDSLREAEKQLPPVENLAIGILDPSISHNGLQSVFLGERENFHIWMWSTQEGSESPFLVLLWMSVRRAIHSLRLVSIYLDMQESRNSSQPDPHSSHMQACLALAAVYFIRLDHFSVPFRGVRMCDAGPTLSTEIRRLLSEEAKTWSQDPSRFEYARLWILFVGAQAEQMPLRGRPEPTTAWFNRRFAQQARRIGLLSWREVRSVLQLFLYHDELVPHASQWYFKTMSASLESESAFTDKEK